MSKINKHIEIVLSSTPRLNSMGKKSRDMIHDVLKRHYQRVGVTLVDDTNGLEDLVSKQPDLVFLGLKELPRDSKLPIDSQEKVWASAFFETQGVNYSGSSANAIALDLNKDLAKHVVKTAGLKTADYFLAGRGQYRDTQELPINFPLFLKPLNAGGGKGIDEHSVVRDFLAFERKVQSITGTFKSDALVEAYLPGREFSVAILETPDAGQLVMPIELITEGNQQGDKILSGKIKAADTEHVIAIEDENIRQAVSELAVNAFQALGARDYGRIDIRLDSQGVPHFLEANLIPGLAQHDFTSYFTSACSLIQDIDYETMILSIVELGLSRGSHGLDSLLDPASASLLPLLNPSLDTV